MESHESRTALQSISGPTMLGVVLLTALILAVAGVLIITLSILLLVFAGIVFGVFLNRLSHWIARYTPLSYRWSYGAVVLLLVLGCLLGFSFMGRQIAQQAQELSTQLESSTQKATEYLQGYDWLQAYLPASSKVQSYFADGILPSILQGVQSVVWLGTGVLVVLFVGLYAAFDPALYRTGLVKLVPLERRQRASEVLQAMSSALANWILGRLISMVAVGVLTTIGLSLLSVPLPITLGVIAALLTFIPNIGPIVATVPQALLALNVSPGTVLYVILLNLVLQLVESYLMTPIIQRYTVTLPPIVTIFAQLLLGVVIGLIGVVMAAPLATAIMVLVQMLYVHDYLGDSETGQFEDNAMSST